MLPVFVALATHTQRVGMADLNRVAAALQKQVTRDFTPLWGIEATISAFAAEDVPQGFWPIGVRDEDLANDAEGLHLTDIDGTPDALVRFGTRWSVSASHELLGILVDPFGNRKVAGQSPAAGAREHMSQIGAGTVDRRLRAAIDSGPGAAEPA